MLHVRVISPPDLTAVTVGLLQASPAVTHLWVSEGSARKPQGDVVSCDVAREAAAGVIGRLRDLGLSRDGAIVVERLDIILSAAAERAEREAPGEGADALIWEELEQNAGEETRLSVTYLTFMIIAMLIASIGVLLDQPILIIGAMVVGPEFGPLVALCVSIVGSPPSSGQSCPRCAGARVFGRNGGYCPLHLGPNGFRPCPEIDADRRTPDDQLHLAA
jgi:hypothetical protein